MLAKTLMDQGIELVSGGTDNHLILVKTDSVNMSGKEAGEILEKVDITCNKNMVPNDKRSPFVTSGIRLGTPAVTTRGFKENETKIMADLIVKALRNSTNEKVLQDLT
jgi:glycine hydroxymethyltransferase